MTILNPKTLLIAASLISGGAVGGVSALDDHALEAIGNAPESVDIAAPAGGDAITAETEADVELEVDVAAEAAAVTRTETPPGVEATRHPGRRALAAASRGATHRNERATAALARARARSPLTNRGAAHRNERATAAIERACDRDPIGRPVAVASAAE